MQKIKASIIAGAVCCLALGGSVAGASQVLLTGNDVEETHVRETVEKQGDTWTCTREVPVQIDGKTRMLKQSGPCTVWELGRAYEKLQSGGGQDPRVLEADLMRASEERDHYKRLSHDQAKLFEGLVAHNPEIKDQVERLKARLSGPSVTRR